jgi:hypothetical protein
MSETTEPETETEQATNLEVAMAARIHNLEAEVERWKAKAMLIPSADDKRDVIAFAQAYVEPGTPVFSFDGVHLALPISALLAMRADLLAAVDTLIWCSGANDFQQGGLAENGWNKLARPLIALLRHRLKVPERPE